MRRIHGTGETLRDLESRLGALALRAGMVTPDELQRAVAIQNREKIEGKLPRQLGLILLADGVVDELEISYLLCHQHTSRHPPF
ncbi:MAG TPA: hypothetical protein VE981_07490 [Planctomycetota bacterium]|nr:hypothetical protein [Planctomycetota bacterium]